MRLFQEFICYQLPFPRSYGGTRLVRPSNESGVRENDERETVVISRKRQKIGTVRMED